MEDLFDVNVNVKQPDQKNDSAALNEFRPRARKASDKVYKATLRFLPFWKNPQSGSLVSKYTVFLENKLTGEKKELDDPSSVGEPSPFTQTFFELRNSPDPILKENSKQFSRKLRYAALVQIISCPSEPQLENRVLVYRFGTKIAQLLQNETNPSNPEQTPVSPFSLTNGRYLFLKVTEKSGFDNTDESGFYDSKDDRTKVKCPVQTATGVQLVPINSENLKNAAFKQTVTEWLKNVPDLEQYQYHPLSDSDKEWAMNIISLARNPQASMAASQAAFSNGFGMKPAAAPTVSDGTFSMNAGPINPSPMASPSPMTSPMPSVDPILDAPVANEAVNPGFSGSVGMPNLDDILGTTTAPTTEQHQQQSVNTGISLGDVIGDII